MANESLIHNRNLKFLLIEVCNFLNGLSPPIMNEVFQTSDCPYDLRNQKTLASKLKSTIKYGIKTMSFKSHEIWKSSPLENTS